MGWFDNIFNKILGEQSLNEQKTEVIPKESTEISRIVDDDFLLELEEKLLRLDCGIEFAEYIINQIKIELKKNKKLSIKEAQEKVKEVCIKILREANKEPLILPEDRLCVIFVSGINGSGKTTSLGKLAHQLKNKNRKVLIAPCDTFRAAAGEQLAAWAQRANVDILSIEDLSSVRPDSVLFKALQECKDKEYEILLVDTAGRLQTKKDLMEELKKTVKILEKHAPENTISERWMVLDATTGQNGYLQAATFHEATNLTGIILSKFDGSAKGGIIFAIAYNLKLPVRFLGIGEKIDQLIEFKEEFFTDSIL